MKRILGRWLFWLLHYWHCTGKKEWIIEAGGRALLSRRAINNRTWKGQILKCLCFQQICLNLEMFKGFIPRHRIKTFYRHEDWSSNDCLNAVLGLFRSGWNKDQSGAGEMKWACVVSFARHNQVQRLERLEGRTRTHLSSPILWEWKFALILSLQSAPHPLAGWKLTNCTVRRSPNLSGMFLPMAISNCLNDVTFTKLR